MDTYVRTLGQFHQDAKQHHCVVLPGRRQKGYGGCADRLTPAQYPLTQWHATTNEVHVTQSACLRRIVSAPIFKVHLGKKMEEKDPFDRFWSVYPKRTIPNKAAARKKFLSLIKKYRAEDIIHGAEQYAHDIRNKIGTEFVAMAITWLNQERWRDYERADKPLLPPAEVERLMAKYRAKQNDL